LIVHCNCLQFDYLNSLIVVDYDSGMGLTFCLFLKTSVEGNVT